jgi:serine/threonine protein kinase
VKGYEGVIRGDRAQWQVTGGKVYRPSPVEAILGKAKDLKSWLRDQDQPARVFVDGIVVLTNPTVQVAITAEEDEEVFRIMKLPQAVEYMLDPHRIDRPPGPGPKSIALQRNTIVRHLERQYLSRKARKDRVGDFELERPLGEGEGYEDHLAQNLAYPTRPHVRLRLYRNNHLEPDGQERRQRREEIERHASALMQLRSEHIPRAETGFIPRQGFYAQPLEWIEGPSVRELLEQRAIASMPVRARVEIALGVARALEHAHEMKILHRDVRPENIVVPPHPRKVMLVDFEVARIEGLKRTVHRNFVKRMDPRYTAPEVDRDSRKVSPASDQYALGVVLYELLTAASLERKEFSPASAPHLEALSPEAREAITRMCARKPQDRFARWDEAVEWMKVI